MKKFLAIVFLLLMLFYTIGYKMVFMSLQYKVDKEMNNRLEIESYNPEETFTVKIPINLPYPINYEGFQKADGHFEHEGEFYHLVKQKIEQDTLYVVLIKNEEKKKIHTRMTEFENVVNNLPASQSKNTLLLKYSYIKDYMPTKSHSDILYRSFVIIPVNYHQYSFSLIQRPTSPFSPPPELQS